MNEIYVTYYVVSILFLCLSIIQITVHLAKDLCRHMRSSRRKKGSTSNVGVQKPHRKNYRMEMCKLAS